MHNIQDTTSRKDIFIGVNVKALTSYIAKRVGHSSNPSISKTKPTLPKISPGLKATLARMYAVAAAKLTPPQQDILEKANQYGMSYQLEISESEHWDKFVDTVYQWEDTLEEAVQLNIKWNESNYTPEALLKLIEDKKDSNNDFFTIARLAG